MTADDRRWVRVPDALHRFTLAGAVVLPPDEPDAVVLAGPGADVWGFLAEPATAAQLIEELAVLYGADADVVATDVAALLDDLVARHLITSVP